MKMILYLENIGIDRLSSNNNPLIVFNNKEFLVGLNLAFT